MGRRKHNKNKNKRLDEMATHIMISCEYNNEEFINFKATYLDKDYQKTTVFFNDQDPVLAWKKVYNYCVKRHMLNDVKKIIIGETTTKWITRSSYKFEKDHNGTNVLVKSKLPF